MFPKWYTDKIVDEQESVSAILPRPGGAFGDEIIAGENELVDAEDAFLFECGDGAGARHSLHSPLERLVNFLRKHHRSISLSQSESWSAMESFTSSEFGFVCKEFDLEF